MKGRRNYIAVWAAALLLSMAASIPAGAVTLEWDELTSAQQEKAYNDLLAENQALKERMPSWKGSSGRAPDSRPPRTTALPGKAIPGSRRSRSRSPRGSRQQKQRRRHRAAR